MGALNEAAGHVDIYFLVRNIILLLPFRQVNMFFFLTLFIILFALILMVKIACDTCAIEKVRN